MKATGPTAGATTTETTAMSAAMWTRRRGGCDGDGHDALVDGMTIRDASSRDKSRRDEGGRDEGGRDFSEHESAGASMHGGQAQ